MGGMKGRHREGIRRGDGEKPGSSVSPNPETFSFFFSSFKVQISYSCARGEEMRIYMFSEDVQRGGESSHKVAEESQDPPGSR